MRSDDRPQPVTIAQAWSAPIVACLVGAGLAIWGLRTRPEDAGVTATLIIAIAGPATATALIARGIVGVYRRHFWAGGMAVGCGLLLIACVVALLRLLP